MDPGASLDHQARVVPRRDNNPPSLHEMAGYLCLLPAAGWAKGMNHMGTEESEGQGVSRRTLCCDGAQDEHLTI